MKKKLKLMYDPVQQEIVKILYPCRCRRLDDVLDVANKYPELDTYHAENWVTPALEDKIDFAYAVGVATGKRQLVPLVELRDATVERIMETTLRYGVVVEDGQ